jgi:glyoxylase-like metal-dependent hydrolase (beta-lactamase superfamily II)
MTEAWTKISRLPGRRDLLKAAAATGALLAAPRLAFAQSAPEFALTPLTGALSLATGAGCNVVVGAEPDGLTLVDGGLKENAAAFQAFLFGETGADRIKTLFNTHWHPEVTGLNETAGAAGAKIVAHENTRLWLSHEFHLWWQDRTYAPLPEIARPNETFHKSWEGPFGEGGVEAGYMIQSHTDGDIFVKFPGANIVASGGVGVADGWPTVDWGTGGWIGGILDGLQVLIDASDGETRIVPTSGPVVTRADLQEQHEMYTTITQRLAELMRRGYGFAEVLAADPTAEFNDRWGDPEQFVTLAYRSIWGHIRNDRRVSTI